MLVVSDAGLCSCAEAANKHKGGLSMFEVGFELK